MTDNRKVDGEKGRELNSEIVGNNYMIIGSVEKKAWLESMRQWQLMPFEETLAATGDFKSYGEISIDEGGWFREGATPPVMEPPESHDWVKS